MKVSIILPSLNVREYIEECIESALNQSLKEVEIICVDAGSTDGTLEIIKSYMRKDSRVSLIISEKKSYGYQMNLGIDAAQGEYIGILETDDYIPVSMYDDLYSIAKKNDADFVKADFYRFTGKGNSLSKAHYKLAQFKYYYNKVIDIQHCQEAFQFTMNTWSGIYKKEFLAKNKIRHNETPGASYQDNGFWFQTFIYAKRAFFVDKPYYMNRRDNDNSSVYSKGKVYCICDEYDFIFNILSNNKQLLDNFGFVFAYACFMAYKGNLNRIGDEYKKDFLIRWSQDLKKYRDLGLLDFKKFDGLDWEMIIQIMDNPEDYYEKYIVREKEFLEDAKKEKNIIIYGAGMIGRRVLEKLVYCDNPANVISFAVTKKEENFEKYKGISIKEITELLRYKDDSCVIIGTTPVYHDEIRNILKKYGFKKIIAAPYEQGKDERYYRKLDYEQKKQELKNWYQITTGKNINYSSINTLNEKIQWSKLNDCSEIKMYLSDKANLREYVEEKIGKDHVIRLYGMYENANQVPYDELPKSVFLRCAHNDYKRYIEDTTETDRFNWEVISRRLNTLLCNNHAYTASMELWYQKAKPRIIVEVPDADIILNKMYKVVCFNGKAKYFVVENDKGIWDSEKRDFYDVKWNHLDYKLKYPNLIKAEEKPKALNRMIKSAEEICDGLDFAVVYFYLVNEKIIFDDMRFTLGSGVEYEGRNAIFI